MNEEEGRDELPYLPFRPPDNLADRLRMLWEYMDLPEPDSRHPSQYRSENNPLWHIGYNPVAEAERALRD